MYRRGVLAGATAVFLAGCSDLTGMLDDAYVDATLQEQVTAEFSADDGEVLAVEVDVQEVDDDEVDQGEEVDGSDSITFRIDHADDGPIETRSIEESDSFEIAIEDDGTYIAIVSNGVADVTIEPVDD